VGLSEREFHEEEERKNSRGIGEKGKSWEKCEKLYFEGRNIIALLEGFPSFGR
jgi:hypothetical protein